MLRRGLCDLPHRLDKAFLGVVAAEFAGGLLEALGLLLWTAFVVFGLMERSSYIAYFDESGDHGLDNIDASYPVFVLCGCVFKTDDA